MKTQAYKIPNIIYKLAIELSVFTDSSLFYADNNKNLELYKDEVLIAYIKINHNIKTYNRLSIPKLIPKIYKKLLSNSKIDEELWNRVIVSNDIARCYYSLSPYEKVANFICKNLSYLFYKNNILIIGLKKLPKIKTYFVALSFPDFTEFSSLIQIYDNYEMILYGPKHNLNSTNLKILKKIFYTVGFSNYENI